METTENNDRTYYEIEVPKESTVVGTVIVLTTAVAATYGIWIAGKQVAEKAVNWKQNRDRKKNLNVVNDK